MSNGDGLPPSAPTADNDGDGINNATEGATAEYGLLISLSQEFIEEGRKDFTVDRVQK